MGSCRGGAEPAAGDASPRGVAPDGGDVGARDGEPFDATTAAVDDVEVPDPGGDGGAANAFADASGTVEIFVNGASLGKTTSPGAMLKVSAALDIGRENVVALRATSGGGGTAYARAEIAGAFGKLATERMWRARAATGDEMAAATGAWATASYDDAAWPNATAVGAPAASSFPTDARVDGLWTSSPSDQTVLLRARIYLPAGYAPDAPAGFGHAVTGGAGGTVVTVSTIAELEGALCGSQSGGSCTDATPRIIQVPSRVFDFTGTEGASKKTVCYQRQCPTGDSELRVDDGFCSGKTTWTADVDAAALKPLLVGSNKTLIGLGPGATLKGKGLTIRGGVHNVIVRNVTISDLNPQVIWGGDAITIDDASDVWIDHNRVARIGRMMVVTGWGKAANVTISWNEFDGVTPYSADCNHTHYWLWLFLGAADTITVSNNWVHDTSGRGPHAGGLLDAQVLSHLVNNYYNYVPGHALDAEANTYSSGGTAHSDLGILLAEGNYFDRVNTPVLVEVPDGKGFGPGRTFAPNASNIATTDDACRSALGRACVANVAVPQAGTFPIDLAATSALASRPDGVSPYAAEEVPSAVPHLAGPGRI